MLTDYARQNKPPQRNHKRILLTIVVLLIAILLPLSMFYMRYHKTAHHKAQKNAAVKKPSSQLKKSNNTAPQFDFYTLLPKMDVPIPKTKTPVPTIQNKNVTYALQVSAVRSHRGAKRISKRLSHLGYRAYIQSYQSSTGNTWYRILVGPYQTIYAADSDQRQLHNKNHLESLLLRIKSS